MNETAIVPRNAGAMVEGGIDWQVLEEVITKGNLSKLTPQQRTIYYRQACESLGFNPLTRPFEYIEFYGGKDKGMVGQLYATRNATDQLRRMHNVNVEIVSQRVEGGILTVHVRATMGTRTEEEIGSLFIEGMQGQELANAHMKAITKAKRRATLAIVGLSFMDETEAETLPRARFLTDEDLAQREMAQAPRITAGTAAPPAAPTPVRANLHQLGQLRALADQGFDLAGEMIVYGVHAPEDLLASEAVELINKGRVAVRRPETARTVPIGVGNLRVAVDDSPAPEPPVPATVSTKDLTRMWTVATNTGYDHDAVHALITQLYPAAKDADGKVSSKLLTPTAVQHLINVMESEPHAVDESKPAGARAMADFWQTVKPAGWTTQAVQEDALDLWPEVAGPAGSLDGAKVTIGQLAQLGKLIRGELLKAYDADGKAVLRTAEEAEGESVEG